MAAEASANARPETLSAEAFRRLAELSPDGMLAHRDGRVVWANQAAAQLGGHAHPDELIGKSVFDYVEPGQRAGLATEIAQVFTQGQAKVGSQRTFVRRNGERFEAELQRFPIGDGLMLVVVRNLEAYRVAERQQRSAELRARAFFDATTEAMGISRLGVHVEANRAYAKLFGYDDPEKLVGLPILDLIDPSEHPRIKELVVRRGRGEDVPDSYSVLARRLDGTTFLMGVKGSSYTDGQDHITIVVVRDITEQQAEDLRLRHREKLEAIGRLAGGVAHDFNNILAAILGNAELSLASLPPGSPLHGNLVTICEATYRAGDLVRQILTFGRRDLPAPRALDLGQVVGEALGLVRAGIPSTVALQVTLRPLGATVIADATQVHQIVLNLCANARDAVGSSGTLEVFLEPCQPPRGAAPGRWARLRVRDDGAGMDAATRTHLFEPYLTTKSEQGGHGLGLAVVHGIVASLGGLIQVESEVGSGSTFDVFFPLSELPTVAAPRPVVAGGGHEHLLLVDDEPLVRSAVKRLLESLGYQVTVASDGAEALELLRARPGEVDLVLSDITMPRVSGVELARALLVENPGAKIILYTGFSDSIDAAHAKALGLKALLAKPIGREDLAAALRAALDPEPAPSR